MNSMKSFIITDADDNTVKEYPCSKWEISLMIVSATKVFPLRGVIEFKTYEGNGNQVTERHYFSEFYIKNDD